MDYDDSYLVDAFAIGDTPAPLMRAGLANLTEQKRTVGLMVEDGTPLHSQQIPPEGVE